MIFTKKQRIMHHILFLIISPFVEIFFNLGRVLSLGFLFKNDYVYSMMIYFNRKIIRKL